MEALTSQRNKSAHSSVKRTNSVHSVHSVRNVQSVHTVHRPIVTRMCAMFNK